MKQEKTEKGKTNKDVWKTRARHGTDDGNFYVILDTYIK